MYDLERANCINKTYNKGLPRKDFLVKVSISLFHVDYL